MQGYMLYRKEGHTAVVLIAEDDDELFYLLNKLKRSRERFLKEFSGELIEQYFEEIN